MSVQYLLICKWQCSLLKKTPFCVCCVIECVKEFNVISYSYIPQWLLDLLLLALNQAGYHCSIAPMYHAADKHDTPPSHFKLIWIKPALL